MKFSRAKFAAKNYTDKITYTDEEILDCINNGVRFIRRTIANMRPALLMSEVTGTLAAGTKSITLAKRPIKIINVTAGDTTAEKGLHETDIAFISPRSSDATGTPREFFLTGSQTINFFPIPDTGIRYAVRTVDDIAELSWEDNSPLSNEFDDFLIEYAALRLSVGNEYDMTQESQLIASIITQINQILTPPPAGVLTQGYWGRRSKAGDY